MNEPNITFTDKDETINELVTWIYHHTESKEEFRKALLSIKSLSNDNVEYLYMKMCNKFIDNSCQEVIYKLVYPYNLIATLLYYKGYKKDRLLNFIDNLSDDQIRGFDHVMEDTPGYNKALKGHFQNISLPKEQQILYSDLIIPSLFDLDIMFGIRDLLEYRNWKYIENGYLEIIKSSKKNIEPDHQCILEMSIYDIFSDDYHLVLHLAEVSIFTVAQLMNKIYADGAMSLLKIKGIGKVRYTKILNFLKDVKRRNLSLNTIFSKECY